jgi:hypothetical protein
MFYCIVEFTLSILIAAEMRFTRTLLAVLSTGFYVLDIVSYKFSLNSIF